MTTRWTGDAFRADRGAAAWPAAPRITRGQLAHPLPGFDLWDHWPLTGADGMPAPVAGGEIWFFLSAPRAPDPDARHDAARIRALWRRGDAWTDLGPALPDGFSPGSREWAGWARLDGDRVLFHFTAAGHRGEAALSFDQRLFATTGRLATAGAAPRLDGWSAPVETARPDDRWYARDMAGGGGLGTIKAFRDPFVFDDPAAGEHLLFTASRAGSPHGHNGVVGIAARAGGGWRALPPLVSADGLSNELERPHVVLHGGARYLFWSTQASVFAPGHDGPTGLYGMVADALFGDWRPLNGSGLVFANPPDAPHQAYSWLVLPDLRVHGFADLVDVKGKPSSREERRAAFSGCPMPTTRLRLRGASADLALA